MRACCKPQCDELATIVASAKPQPSAPKAPPTGPTAPLTPVAPTPAVLPMDPRGDLSGRPPGPDEEEAGVRTRLNKIE